MNTAAQADGVEEHWNGDLSIAGRRLSTTIDGSAAVAGFLPAMAHLTVPTTAPAADADRLTVWSSPEPHPLWAPDRFGPLRVGANGVAMARVNPAAIEYFDPSIGTEVWGQPAAFSDALMCSQPASTPLAAWLSGHGVHVLHLGAVCFDGRAVLLIGTGGAGKSTTTLASSLAGGGFIGDDFCAVELGGERTTVHSMFASCKLTPTADDRLGHPDLPTIATTNEHKRVVLVHGSVEVIRSAPVASMLILRPPGTAPTEPIAVSPSAALRALRATAIKVALGAMSFDQWMSSATGLARAVPAFEMGLTWELDRVVEGVRRAAAAP